ncbi:MAG: D-erythritol 1-phosphate dehydrogenase [Methylobacteriaceae bacterium]|nr:D-erythritol 1-phosphate dehydrogenase [Methylobacteriaceae bacterium]
MESPGPGKAGPYDLLIIGGGINGAGIARDAAGRGLKVLLLEQDDLAACTSSASTKLIHGGLRYLETYDFRLVRESLIERERLLEAAPHLVRPLRFVLPHDPLTRPAWLVRLGLFLYDHLAPRKRLPPCERLDLAKDPRGAPLKLLSPAGFAYSDCAVDDSRLVVVNAVDAAARGALIRTRTRLEQAERAEALWNCMILDRSTGGMSRVRARALINAAGPWVSEVLNSLGRPTQKHVRLVKGSHIVVRKLYEGEHAYMLQNPDRRIVFAIPYEGDFTLIGTTDVPYEEPPGHPVISDDEADYLLETIARWFKRPAERADIMWTYSGVRPLFDDGSHDVSAMTRDYAFDLDAPEGAAPLLSIFGGKLTTYRRLAEHALDDLARFFPQMSGAWTGDAPLPGGDMPDGDIEAYAREFAARHAFLSPDTARRLVRGYGRRAEEVIGEAKSLEGLGRDFGAGLSEAEVRYLAGNEWARSADDVLWRRSKLGLRVAAEAEQAIDALLTKTGATNAADDRLNSRVAGPDVIPL